GVLPAAVVDWSCLPPLRARMGQWRPDRRDLPQAGRQEEKDAARRSGRLSKAVVQPSSVATMASMQLCSPNRHAMNGGWDTTEILQMPVKPPKAMVLAAGLGLRMRPLTDRLPKPLIPVAGRPLLDHVLDKLGDTGVTEAVVNVHYLGEQIIQHVASRKRPRVI